jgi:hypothetical protein
MVVSRDTCPVQVFRVHYTIDRHKIHVSGIGIRFCKFIKNSRAQYVHIHITMDLINALPGNSSVNTLEHAAIEETVSSVDSTYAPIHWLDSGHVICVYCKSMSVPRLYK